MNTKGQGHLLTLVQSHSDSTFLNCFSLQTTRPIETKFHVEPPWDLGTKVYLNVAAMSVYGKNLKTFLLWNQNADE